mmetsp:Transcript_13387/g.34873  ORF Transcript_13387/g.34873 Transcript_13387/m.34873 type:complete len:299 (-) Transcript_13387:652-1548(-)
MCGHANWLPSQGMLICTRKPHKSWAVHGLAGTSYVHVHKGAVRAWVNEFAEKVWSRICRVVEQELLAQARWDPEKVQWGVSSLHLEVGAAPSLVAVHTAVRPEPLRKGREGCTTERSARGDAATATGLHRRPRHWRETATTVDLVVGVVTPWSAQEALWMRFETLRCRICLPAPPHGAERMLGHTVRGVRALGMRRLLRVRAHELEHAKPVSRFGCPTFVEGILVQSRVRVIHHHEWDACMQCRVETRTARRVRTLEQRWVEGSGVEAACGCTRQARIRAHPSARSETRLRDAPHIAF